MNSRSIQGVVLAAGYSRRFTGDKTLLTVDGMPLSAHIGLKLSEILANVVIIVNEENHSLREHLEKYQLKYIINYSKKNTGIGSSISVAVSSSGSSDGWLFCLGDMPFVKSSTYLGVLKNLQRSDDIVVPRFNKLPGNPVGFGCKYKSQLINKLGDTGAKSIVNNNSGCVTYLDVQDEGIIMDIDTRQDADLYSIGAGK